MEVEEKEEAKQDHASESSDHEAKGL